MPLLSEKNPLNAMRVLMYGAAGAGKTHLLGTFARAGGLAIADCDDDGVDTLLGARFKTLNPWFNPATVEYEKFNEPLDQFGMPVSDTPQAFWKLIQWLNKKIDDPNIKTIAIDSLSSVSIIALYAGMRANMAKGRSQTWKDRATMHMLLTTQADFGGEMTGIKQIFDVIKRASAKQKHVIVTAHIRENRTDAGVLISREPLITGDRLRAQVANTFSDVWFLDVLDKGGGKNVRRLFTDTTPGLKGIKSRLGVPGMEEPHYDKIIAQLKS